MSLAGKFTDVLPDSQGAHPGAHVHVGTVSGHAPSDAIIIPDAHLLFGGDFKRSGVDLILSGDDHEVVLHDYFKGEKRAALASPDGAHLTGDLVNALAGGNTQFAQADGSASVAPPVIGHVTKLAGTATAIRNGVSIILNQGDNVNKGDVVASGSDSTLGITFIDGTVFGLASNAKMVLNEMIYDPNGSDNKSLISLVQGTISFVAGATAKHGDMKVDTPVATMGIRGTAVLVEIDFTVPASGGAPPAKFQVLVEPDGTTGSYILFDKTTLTPIATVNQAGTQTVVNGQGGVNFLSSAQLSADAQKIISDVFALKFSDLNNPNTKLTTNFTDSIVPQTFFLKLASGEAIPVDLQLLFSPEKAASGPAAAAPSSREHIPGPPTVGTDNGTTAERFLTTGSSATDSVTGSVAYFDINPGDVPSVKARFDSATYKNAGHTDVTATLTAEQLAAIHAVEVPLTVVQDPAGLNLGAAIWTYSVPDGALDFLAAGEVLTLTYVARVDNNFAPNVETTFKSFTITITGTNDKPTIATSGDAITERIGTGNTATDVASGIVTFTDADLTDRPVVSTSFSDFKYLDAQGNDVTGSLTAEQLAAILAVEVPLTVVQGTGNSHNGSATWTYSISDHAFDFIAKGETLILNYVAQVDDGHGGVVSTPVSVSINGADVSVIGTNDIPTIAATSNAFAERSNDSQPNPTGSTTADTVSGTISFTDVDLTDRPVASTAFASFTYTDAQGHALTLTPLQQADVAAVSVPLNVTQTAGNSNNGSATWTYSAADGAFDFLAAGEILTLTYTATVDDGHGGVVTAPITVTITGTNDTPTSITASS
ncbi:MAG: VCBS domain-containing protein, partial [Bradyrhizobium sp.]